MATKSQPAATGWLRDIAMFRRTSRGELRAKRGKRTRRIVPICVSAVRTDNRTEADGYRRVRYRRTRSEICLTDSDGQFVDALVDGAYRMQTYLTCLNNPTFVAEALDLIRSVMEKGCDGVLIRFDRQPQECHAEGRHIGYVKRFHSVASEVPWLDQYDQRVRDLAKHEHLYPGQPQDYAFERFVAKAKRLARAYGSDRVVVLEGSAASAGRADALHVRARPEDIERTPGGNGKPVIISSRPSAGGDEALSGLSSAWLHGCAYVADEGISGRAVDRLAGFDRGRRLRGASRLGIVKYALYENAIVAVNSTDREAAVWLQAPQEHADRRFIDLATGSTMTPQEHKETRKPSPHDVTGRGRGNLLLKMPARSGKVLLVE